VRDHAEGAFRRKAGGRIAGHAAGDIPDSAETIAFKDAGGQAGAVAGAANQSDVAFRIKFDMSGAQHRGRDMERP